MSAAPPGAKVLTMRTGRDGHSSAGAGDAERISARLNNTLQNRFILSPRSQPKLIPSKLRGQTLYPEFVALAAFGDVEEQLVEREPPLDQALLARIGHQPLEIPGVALAQSVLPRVLA